MYQIVPLYAIICNYLYVPKMRKELFMPVKLFILGRPGGGKSHATRYVEKHIKIFFEKYVIVRRGWFFCINDYTFLKQLFVFDQYVREETQRRFKATDYGGFEVLDPRIFDEALNSVRKVAIVSCKYSNYDLVIIEFARPNYRKALQVFGEKFLQDAYFLFIDADLAACFERIQNRAANPQNLDDTFVSEKTLDLLYREDNRLYMSVGLATDFRLQQRQIRCIDNMTSIEDFEAQLSEFFQFIFNREFGHLPETDPAQLVPGTMFESELAK